MKEELIERALSGGSVKWFAHCITSERFEFEMLRDFNKGYDIQFSPWTPVDDLRGSSFDAVTKGQFFRPAGAVVAHSCFVRSDVRPNDYAHVRARYTMGGTRCVH